uniref:Uncharacterized protein n=1 Tax=Arundo donax TaxID=35708 RepID=A0A0A9G824_ARUDO
MVLCKYVFSFLVKILISDLETDYSIVAYRSGIFFSSVHLTLGLPIQSCSDCSVSYI